MAIIKHSTQIKISCIKTGLAVQENNALKKMLTSLNTQVFNNLNFLKASKAHYLVSLVLTGTNNIIKFNYQLRNLKQATNVLSLQLYNPQELSSIAPSQTVLLGDIYICLDTTKVEAQVANISFNEHLSRLYIHGLLHLLGFTHDSEVDAKKMYLLENDLIKKSMDNTNILGLVNNFWYNN